MAGPQLAVRFLGYWATKLDPIRGEKEGALASRKSGGSGGVGPLRGPAVGEVGRADLMGLRAASRACITPLNISLVITLYS